MAWSEVAPRVSQRGEAGQTGSRLPGRPPTSLWPQCHPLRPTLPSLFRPRATSRPGRTPRGCLLPGAWVLGPWAVEPLGPGQGTSWERAPAQASPLREAGSHSHGKPPPGVGAFCPSPLPRPLTLASATAVHGRTMPPSTQQPRPLWGKLRPRPSADTTEGAMPGVGGAPGDGAHGRCSCHGRPGPDCGLHTRLRLTPQECAPPSLTSFSCPSCLERKPAQSWLRSPGGSPGLAGA